MFILNLELELTFFSAAAFAFNSAAALASASSAAAALASASWAAYGHRRTNKTQVCEFELDKHNVEGNTNNYDTMQSGLNFTTSNPRIF